MSRQFTAIIVDDESLARQGLSLKLGLDARFKVVELCRSGEEALKAIEQYQPDVAFLDIEMPGVTGLQLAEQLVVSDRVSPKIVFVTAFSDFALRAFEFEAFDYLLKPISDERLAACLEKLVMSFSTKDIVLQHQKLDEMLGRKTGNSIGALLHNLEVSNSVSMHELQQTVSLKSGSDWIRVKLDNILWIEAAGDYMCVYTQDGTHIIRQTLKQFEQELDMQRFPRVNRSAIINLSHMLKLAANANGEYVVHLTSDIKVKVGRKYRFNLDKITGGGI
jgi:two-component system LytT family response regulator